jgi:translation initiation factor 4G
VQVLGIISVSTEVLRKCIPLLFEKAVAEPKFCALYADLSAILSKELASHDYGTSPEGKPITFKRELLNTCQACFHHYSVYVVPL